MVGIHVEYVMNQLEEGKWKEIKREIQQEMKKKPQASDLYCYLAVCLAKQIEESIIFEKMVLNLEMDRALHQALTLDPSSSLAHFVRGIKYRETPLMFGGNYEKSLSYLQRAQDLGFGGIMLPLELAKTYIQLKEMEKAKEQIAYAREINPTQADIKKVEDMLQTGR